jgi:hypothetical protein
MDEEGFGRVVSGGVTEGGVVEGITFGTDGVGIVLGSGIVEGISAGRVVGIAG